MFTRYKTDGKGKQVVVAKVYTAKEHNIHSSQVDRDCLWAIRKLWNSGHKAYIVGGAVRDLLLGKRPKDFDIATSASPRQVQNIFWNSRAIGKRFRIVHLYFSAGKIIEVTTFRSDEENFEEGNNNIFGTIEQDSRRRDFSINALYYNPLDGHLLDFNNAMDDIRSRTIRSLIPLSYSFKEDPVRMIRAIKYSCTTGFRLKFDVKWAIRRDCAEIEKVSISRLTDEMIKILNSAHSGQILQRLHSYRLLSFMMPTFDVYMKYDSVKQALDRLDEEISKARDDGADYPLSSILHVLATPLVVVGDKDAGGVQELSKEIFRQIKVMLSPLTPPNYEIERAVELILQDLGYSTKKARRKSQPARKKGSGRQSGAQATRDSGKKKRRRSSSRTRSADRSQQPSPASSAEAHDL